jgi:hypothetical protein
MNFDIFFYSDTKLTAKSLVSDITTHAPTLINTPQGRRALFYLLVPRSRRHFTPAQIAIIAETDPIRAKTSKKSTVVREGEIRAAASEGLLKFVADNGAEAARDTGGSLVVLEIMLYADGGWCISLDFHQFVTFVFRQVFGYTIAPSTISVDIPIRGRLKASSN